LGLGQLPIATIRELLADLDRPNPDLHFALGRALKAAGATREPTADQAVAVAERDTDDLVARREWRVGPNAPARRAVANVMAAIRQLGIDLDARQIDEYAAAAEALAAVDLEVVGRAGRPEAMVYNAVVGTILGAALFAGLRRLAQENASAIMFGQKAPPTQPTGG
jgi:hypothetical protein